MVLERVYSVHQQSKLKEILRNPRARHNQRQYVVGFLKHAGYTEKEACDIVHHINQWADYDREYTEYQIRHIFVSNRNTHTPESSQRARRACTLNDIIVLFLKETIPFKLDLPINYSDAVAYYSYLGFTVLPKRKGEKRPSVDWKEYENRKPSREEMMGWDFSNGVCLLANEYYSFLDIDISGYEFLFLDRHKEITPRGGLHVFGKGKMNSINVEGGEIKGIGSLIIASPTPGYVVL